jgi:uncharacterized protein (TIGR02145 family)
MKTHFSATSVLSVVAACILMFNCAKGPLEPKNLVIGNKIIDIDGNVYNTVKIGNQVWMTENLKVTHYRNGDPINTGGEGTVILSNAYYEYYNEEALSETYGCLYNWHAVNNDRKLAPKGCHVPSDQEWAELIYFLGGPDVAGGKLKEIAVTHWNEPNSGATNESGFSALPGGYYSIDGAFTGIGDNATFWTSTKKSTLYWWDLELDAWCWRLHSDRSDILRKNYLKQNGFSVRCIVDK